MQEKWLEVEEIATPEKKIKLRFKESGCKMYVNTKRSIFAFVGTSMAALALVLTLVGIQYDATAPLVTEQEVTEIILKRATPIWAGILLVLFGVRNLTLGGAVWRYKGIGCSDVCEAVLVNILALLAAGGCLGIIIWDALREELFNDLTGNVAFVKFTTLSFILTLEILWALVGCIAACIPVKREQKPEVEHGLENHAFE